MIQYEGPIFESLTNEERDLAIWLGDHMTRVAMKTLEGDGVPYPDAVRIMSKAFVVGITAFAYGARPHDHAQREALVKNISDDCASLIIEARRLELAEAEPKGTA